MTLLNHPAASPILATLPGARLVGGCVRDALAGRPSADIDIAAPFPPETIQARLAEAGFKTIATGLAHGTITAISAGHPVEITSLRRDITTDGRHATVAWTTDFREDAARRDFTINAMSLDAHGTLYDYFGGAADLQAGRVRFVGEPAARIQEDYLRTLRFFRFQARYGQGTPDEAATDAIKTHLAGLRTLSAERVWSELGKILALPNPAPTIDLMHALGVLPAIAPEATNIAALTRLTGAGSPADPLLRLAALLTPAPTGAETLAARLKLSNAERDTLHAMLTAPTPPADADDATLTRLLADTPAAILKARLWLTEPGPAIARLATLPRPIFPLEGRDALALGAQPGPAIGAALRAVRDMWLESNCQHSAAHWRAELARQIKKQGLLF